MKDSTVQDLEQLYTQARSARQRLEGEWFLNVAYYDGLQWLAWDGRGLYRPPLRRGRITVVDNRIQPVVRTEVARMTKTSPVFTVVPLSGEQDDANAAQIGERMMRHFWKHLKMPELSMEALLWSRICGAGFFKVFWDPSIGEKMQVLVGPDGSPLSGPGGVIKHGSPEANIAQSMAFSQGMGMPSVKTVASGDIRVEVRSPFQMGIDPIAETFSEADWIVEETVKSVSYIQDRYGKEVEADAPASPGLIESRMGGGPSLLSSGSSSYKGVRVKEYWCRPCRTHPNGYRAVWTKDGILKTDSKPFDPMPYMMLQGIPVPGRMWPTSIVQQLRGPQTELNKVKSQIAENRNRIGNPTILASKQAVQDPDKFADSTMLPGGVYFYDDIGSPNALPRYLEAPALPEYVVQDIDRIVESIQEISGQHEVTSAQVPPGVTAASAINLLMEADDTRLGPAIRDYELRLGELGAKVLKLAANFYTDARTIRLTGDDEAPLIFDFRGAMLRGNTHVEVQAGSAFPQSKAAKQAGAQDLLSTLVQTGNPPHGRQLAQFLKDWEVGGADKLVADYSRTESQVNRENAKLLQGAMLHINDFDDDQGHVDGHEDMQRSQQYDQASDQAKQAFMMHVGAHRERLSQQQQQQLQQQLEMSGKVPPMMSNAAFQDAQQLSQLQGQQQMQGEQLQQQGQAMQQGMQAAGVEQQQRQAEADHHRSYAAAEAQRLQQSQHLDEQHQQRMSHQAELHELKLQQMRNQASQAKRSPGGRQAA